MEIGLAEEPPEIATMAKVLSLPERHLITELAVGLARRLNEILEPAGNGDQRGPGYVWHSYTSDLENGCDVLSRLNVAHAAPPCFKFFAPDRIREALSGEISETSPSLDEVLTTYLSVVCEYGAAGSCLSSKRAPFIPQEELAREIDALVRLGYLERLGDAVLWADKIAPEMRQASLWQEDGQSNRSVTDANLAAECEAALDSTPEHTKLLLAREAMRMSELDFAILLKDRFDGLFWSKNPDGTARPRPGDVRLVKAVYRSLKTNQ